MRLAIVSGMNKKRLINLLWLCPEMLFKKPHNLQKKDAPAGS